MACLWSSIRTTGSSRDASRGADDENEDSAAWRQAREYRDTVGVGERLRNNDGDGLARSEIFAVAALVNVAARPNPATRPSRLALPASSHPDTPDPDSASASSRFCFCFCCAFSPVPSVVPPSLQSRPRILRYEKHVHTT